jgi:hypothetical protein
MLSQSDKAIRINQVYRDLDRKFEEEAAQKTAAGLKLPYISL